MVYYYIIDKMKKINESNLNQTDTGNLVLFHLLKDFQTQTSLTKLIFPKYKKQKVHPNIQFNFRLIKSLCEIKMIDSHETVRKGNINPYVIKVKGYRIRIQDYVCKYIKFKFSNRTFKILETLCYPRTMRKMLFRENRFEFFERDIEKVFMEFIIHDFVLTHLEKMIEPIAKDWASGQTFQRGSVIKFGKKINRERTPEDLSRAIFLIKSSCNPSLEYSSMLEPFLDEDFIFDLIKNSNNFLFAKSVENSLRDKYFKTRRDIYDIIKGDNRVIKRLINRKSKENILLSGSAIGIAIDSDAKLKNDIFKEYEKDSKKNKLADPKLKELFYRLERLDILIERAKKIGKNLRRDMCESENSFISGNDYLPKQNQHEESGCKAIRPKI